MTVGINPVLWLRPEDVSRRQFALQAGQLRVPLAGFQPATYRLVIGPSMLLRYRDTIMDLFVHKAFASLTGQYEKIHNRVPVQPREPFRGSDGAAFD